MSLTNPLDSLKKYRDFRLLWTGEFISAAGTDMQFVASSWQLYLLTNSAFSLGLVGIVRFIPILLFSLVGGNFADSHNRKKILFVTQSIIALSSLILGLTTLTNTVNAYVIYFSTALTAAAVSFDLPARQALIPSLVSKKDLPKALSIYSIIWEISRIFGPITAGFIIGTSGVALVYIIDFFSTLAVIAALIFMKNDGSVKGEKVSLSLRSIKEGVVFVKTKTIIWSMMILDFVSTFFASATALLPIYAKDILKVGPEGLGVLVAAPSIGALAAAIFMTQIIHKIKRIGLVLIFSVFIYGFFTFVFGLSKNIFLSVAALALVGAGDSVSVIIRQTIRQLVTPDNLRGRMMSVNQIFFFGGPHLGEFEAGLVASLAGASASVALGGIATVISVAVIGIFIPVLRKYKQ